MTNTDHLLSEREHRCEHETLRSEVDDAEEQRVKDQQRGLVSVKEHIAERVSLVCQEKRKHVILAGAGGVGANIQQRWRSLPL